MPNPFWNAEEGRVRAFWRILLFTIVLVAFLLPLAWVGSLVSFVSAANLPALIAMTVAMVFAAKYLDRRSFTSYGLLLNRNWWIDLGFGLALGAGLMAGIFAIESSLGWVTVSDRFVAPEGQSFVVALLVPLVGYISVGIYEEMMSRGYHLINMTEGFNLKGLGPRGGLWIAWILSSAIFGILHMFNPNASFLSSFNIAVAGLLLGLGMVLTQQLAIPIGLHITWNFFQGPVFGFPVSGGGGTVYVQQIEQGGPELWTGGAFGPEAGMMGLIAMGVGMLLTWAWVRYRYGHTTLQLTLAEAPTPAKMSDVSRDPSLGDEQSA